MISMIVLFRIKFGIYITLILIISSLTEKTHAQPTTFQYAASPNQPYGAYNPEAPEQLQDFEPLIGSNLCESVQRNQDGSWQDTTSVTWEFKYIFDGKAVQDITWKEDGNHSSSIRQFNADSSKWAVTFFSANNANFNPPSWYGGKTENGDIVLTRPQQAPGSGTPGTNRLTFSNISEQGFDWIGEWISEDESIVYPYWRIYCKKEEG